jgi:hypothetical protein
MAASASQPNHPPARSVPIVPVILFTAARSVARISSNACSPPAGAPSYKDLDFGQPLPQLQRFDAQASGGDAHRSQLSFRVRAPHHRLNRRMDRFSRFRFHSVADDASLNMSANVTHEL